MKLFLEKRHLDLKVNWKLSRNETTFKENFIVHFETPLGLILSEIAPNIRYGETPDKIAAQFAEWLEGLNGKGVETIQELTLALDESSLFHSLRFGLESVFLKYFALKEGKTLSEYLSLPAPRSVATSFSMPIMPVGEIEGYLAPLSRFQSLKIKVNAESGLEMLQEIHKHTQVKLRVDANEGWKDLDQYLMFEEKLSGMNVELIEQPFAAHMREEYRELKKCSRFTLLADESIEDVGDFSELSQQFHAINVKLMKTGSLLRARDFIIKAKQHGMQAMMGCMIETSVGISYGMLLAGMVEYVDLDGFLLIKEEPFQLVSEKEGILSLN